MTAERKEFTAEERVLERLRYSVQTHIDAVLVDQLANLPVARIEEMGSLLGNKLAVSVRGFLFGTTLEQVECSYPRDWREAIKERFAPAWLKRRWPVQYAKVVLRARAEYPQLRLPPKQPYTIRLMRE